MNSDLMTFDDLRKMVDEIYQKTTQEKKEEVTKQKTGEPISIRKKLAGRLKKRVETGED